MKAGDTNLVKDGADLIGKGVAMLVEAAVKGASTSALAKASKKAAPPADEEEEDDVDLEEQDDETEEEETDDEEETEEESDDEESEEESEDEGTPELKLKDVTAASAKCAKKHSRDYVAKIYKKFGVKSVQDFKKAQYPKVIALLRK